MNLSNASTGLEGAASPRRCVRAATATDRLAQRLARSLNLEFNNPRCEGGASIAEARAAPSLRREAPRRGVEGPRPATATLHGRCGQRLARAPQPQLLRSRPRGAAALAAALAAQATSVTDAGSPDAGRWRHYGGITHLSLFHNRLGAEARALAEALAPRAQPSEDFAFHPTLRSLNVGRNQLGDVGLARIARAFAPVRLRDGSWQYNPTFKHLHANANSCLSQEGPLALSESLAPRQNPDGKGCRRALSTIHLPTCCRGGGRPGPRGRAPPEAVRPSRPRTFRPPRRSLDRVLGTKKSV